MKDKIKWPAGNRLDLCIPLRKITVTEEGTQFGEYVPSQAAAVMVYLVGNYASYEYTPRIEDNKLYISDNGELKPGVYAIDVRIQEPERKLRSFRCGELEIVRETKQLALGDFVLDNNITLDADAFIFGEGPSAFEVAVRDGYTGTKAEWLESLRGKEGRGIADIVPLETGAFRILLTDGSAYITPVLKGEQGVSIVDFTVSSITSLEVICSVTMSDGTTRIVNLPRGEQGEKGDKGDDGQDGRGIQSVVLNADYTITFSYTDGTSYTTPQALRGEPGAAGQDGQDGRGISSMAIDADNHLTVSYTDGTSYTTPQSLQGERGVSITDFEQVGENATMCFYNIYYSNGNISQIALPKGEQGDRGEIGPQGPKGDTVVLGEVGEYKLYNTSGTATDGAMTQDATTKAIAANNGYYECSTAAGTAAKVAVGDNEALYSLQKGGSIKVKMANANAAASGVTLKIGSAAATPLYYNNEPISSSNTWEAGEVISVYFDGTNYQASNAQGGGGKAEKIKYDNSQSGLASNNVQDALDETAIGLKTLEQTSPVNTDSEAESDLDIADEFGRVLARFRNGHVKTKYFNSENIVEAETYPTIQEDLDITDENKKVLARFRNGHIQTKYFDSSVGRGAYSSSTIRFTVDVNVNTLKDSADSATVQDSYVGTYKDNGLLMLPPTYTPQGKPTRLVIAFHGAGGGASDHDSQTEQQTQYKYLVANGYAVMDMNGMPANWVETWWDDCPVPSVKEYCKVNNMGTSLAMECYIKGYEWVIDNYNIARDGVFICGGSMGGMSSSNFVMMGSVPVIAQAIYAPALDTYNQAFLHPWTPVSNPVLSKYCLGKLYGFSKDGNDQYIYDADKVTGYNPIINGMESYTNGERVTSVGTYDFTTHYLNGAEVTEYKRYPCPLKIWHCDNDPTVNIACSIRQVTAIKNAGGMAWLRRFPSGGHAPDTAGTVVSNPSGNTVLNGASVGTIYPLAEETLLFFNRFNNK